MFDAVCTRRFKRYNTSIRAALNYSYVNYSCVIEMYIKMFLKLYLEMFKYYLKCNYVIVNKGKNKLSLPNLFLPIK